MTKQSSSGNLSPNIQGDGNHYMVTQNMQARVANEIKTLQVMISSLTKLARTEEITEENSGEKNPYLKFDERFKDYSPQLKALFTDLTIKYGNHYKTVMNDVSLGRVDIDNICRLLRNKSISILEKNNGNPLIALDELCTYFQERFFGEDITDFEYDDGALRFFLYRQLVECNVFPNPYE